MKEKACYLLSRSWRTDSDLAIGTRAVATETFALEVLAILMMLKMLTVMHFQGTVCSNSLTLLRSHLLQLVMASLVLGHILLNEGFNLCSLLRGKLGMGSLALWS